MVEPRISTGVLAPGFEPGRACFVPRPSDGRGRPTVAAGV